jgi:hypothetical protein
MTDSSQQPKVVILCSGGPASAVLSFLLGKKDQGLLRGSAETLPSSLRLARGLPPEGYALHLLSIESRQHLAPQALKAARLVAGLLDASYEVLNPSALTPLPTTVAASRYALLCALAGVVAVRQGATLLNVNNKFPAMVITAAAVGHSAGPPPPTGSSCSRC